MPLPPQPHPNHVESTPEMQIANVQNNDEAESGRGKTSEKKSSKQKYNYQIIELVSYMCSR